MIRACIALVALAGCDRLLGFDTVHVDPGATTVYVHAISRAVINDPNHLPTVFDTPFDVATIKNAYAVLDDGTRTTATIDPTNTVPGSFFFNRTDETQMYRLFVPSTTADVAPTEYQDDSGKLELLARSWGRSSIQMEPTIQPPGANTRLQFSMLSGLPVASAAAVGSIESTGLWTDTAVANGAMATSPAAFDWASANSLYGPVYMLDGAVQHDRAYYTLHDFLGDSYRVIAGYRVDDVTMTSGMTAVANGPYFALPRDTCVLLDVPLSKEIARVTGAYGAPDGSWKIEAVPVTTMGPEINFKLVEGGGTTDVANTPAKFGSPFYGYGLVLAMEVAATHPIQAAGATTIIDEADGSTQWIEPAASSVDECTVASSFTDSVSLPVAPELDGADISSDSSLALDRSRSHTLSWSLGGASTEYDYFEADLYDVSDDAGRTFMRHVVRFISRNVTPTSNPQIEIDPMYMPAGHTFVLQIVNQLGYMHAADGDFSTIVYPYAQGYVWSGQLEITQ